MSSFQFPANPSDGDIVVRGNLQAFYNAATNTWRVSEVPTAPGIPGPPGPPGPIGPEGKGVEISGAVDTFADLPAPNAHQFEFWIVDDTNKLYNSDGITWRDLGGPIQGPPGDPGEDGNDGTNGQNGRGWYDTNIIDERPSNYQIQFLSNDGLGFTTDNIMGPQGETGSLQVATETTLGGIKIGRGLDIAPDGTASAGVTTVNLETTPVQPGGLQVSYAPIFFELGNRFTSNSALPRNDETLAQQEVELQMPDRANKATVYFYCTTLCQGYVPDAPTDVYGERSWRAFRAYIRNKLTLQNAQFTLSGGGQGPGDVMSAVTYHNLSIPVGANILQERKSVQSITKINEIEFETGAPVKINWEQFLLKGGGTEISAGYARLVVIPYRTIDETSTLQPVGTPFINDGEGTLFYSTLNAQEIEDTYFPPTTPEQEAAEAADLIRNEINQVTTRINNELQYVDGLTASELISYRDQLRDARNLPGTYEDIYNYLVPIVQAVDTLLAYQFRFE
nr:hypothetical protein 34 [bacterium]